MTTHEALKLQPGTLVYHNPTDEPSTSGLIGDASPEHPQLIRIRWRNTIDVDSVISVLDRILLSSIIISEPVTEQDLGKPPV